MSEPTSSITLMPDAAEPKAGAAPVPVWLIILLFLLLYWGMVHFDKRSAWGNAQVYIPYQSTAELQLYQPPSGGASLERGRAVYENVCGLCHNNDGAGKPGQAPPVAGSDWVVGSAERLIRIPLAGLSGPLMVNGQEWNLAMPAMGAALSDEDLAAVLTYMRQSWGNKAPEITPDDVKKVRDLLGNRTQPYSAAELNSVP